MSRLIDADRLLTDRMKSKYYRLPNGDLAIPLIDIEHAPTVDAEPVRHGHWEGKEDPYGFFDAIPVCSVCNCTTKYRETSAYCPNCGAKMDEVTE